MKVVAVGMVMAALLGACSSSSPAPTSASEQAGTEVTVTRVTDGDTIDVLIDGQQDTVRLIGINAPESGECFAAAATAALARLVDGEEVTLVRDQTDRDQYGRLLRYVGVGDQAVNEALVRGGFALAVRFEPDVARADLLDAAQAEAQRDERGLWAPDACGRVVAEAGDLAISRIDADPPGDDTLDPNAELVVVTNGGADAVDLTGWGLKDETASHRFDFPGGFSLAAGADVAVHTGCGTATDADLYWCNQGSAIWNNDGDTAFLLDPNGNVVDSRSYG